MIKGHYTSKQSAYEWFAFSLSRRSLLLLRKLAQERGAILNLGVIIVTLRSLTIRMIPAPIVIVPPCRVKPTNRRGVVLRIVVITHPNRNRALWYSSGCSGCSLCAWLYAHRRFILWWCYQSRLLRCCCVFDSDEIWWVFIKMGCRIYNFYCSRSA